MKNLKITLVALVCLLIINVGMAVTPQTKKIEKEKNAVLKKIKKAVRQTSFTGYMQNGESEQIVLRCIVNKNNKVKVSNVIGFNEELKKAVRRTMAKKQINTTAALSGEELALRLTFKKFGH